MKEGTLVQYPAAHTECRPTCWKWSQSSLTNHRGSHLQRNPAFAFMRWDNEIQTITSLRQLEQECLQACTNSACNLRNFNDYIGAPATLVRTL
eukprot:1158502-Pelagomonas_calceolata.AAC.8